MLQMYENRVFRIPCLRTPQRVSHKIDQPTRRTAFPLSSLCSLMHLERIPMGLLQSLLDFVPGLGRPSSLWIVCGFVADFPFRET